MILTRAFGICATIAVFGLSACHPTDEPADYQKLSAPTLWDRLSRTNDTPKILKIEAELVSRGLTQSPFRNAFTGLRTSSSVGRSAYSRAEDIISDRDCRDFASPAEAQKFFLQGGGPTRDPHGLDSDGDGNACGWGNKLRSSVRQQRQYSTSR